MAAAIEKVKHALHMDKGHSTTHTTGHTTGHTTTSGTSEGVHGPHSSRVANAADPRVDSDLDGSHRGTGVTGTHTGNGMTGTAHTGTGVAGTHTGNGGLTGTSHTGNGLTGNNGYSSTTAGPHSSNIANKVDPRVDSDRDGSRNLGASNNYSTYDGTHAGNTATGYTGTTGGLSNSTNAGPHNSNLANKVDPRVDSDLDGRGNRHGAATGGILGASGSHATPGSGTAQNTAGPHNSDTLNKLDPRVDSDRDNSKTMGGNKTFA